MELLMTEQQFSLPLTTQRLDQLVRMEPLLLHFLQEGTGLAVQVTILV